MDKIVIGAMKLINTNIFRCAIFGNIKFQSNYKSAVMPVFEMNMKLQ